MKFLMGLAIAITSHLSFAEAVKEYEYVQPWPQYYGWEHNGTPFFDTLGEALAQSLAVWCQGRMKCDIKVTGPEKYNTTGWKWVVPVLYSGASVERPDDMFAEEGVVRVYYNCPAEGAWDNYYDSVLNIQRCRRERSVVAECDACEAKPNEPVPSVGNPIVLFNKIKRQVDVDYENAMGTLKFSRTYRSDTGRWAHNYESVAIDYNRIGSAENPSRQCFLDTGRNPIRCFPYVEMTADYNFVLMRGNGRRVRFGTSINYLPASDINDRATPVFNQHGQITRWKVSNTSQGSVEEYSLDGRLRLVTDRNGRITTLTYSSADTPKEVAPIAGLLTRVADAFGAALNFKYNSRGQMSSMTDLGEGVFLYEYDDFGNVTSVTYPDGKMKKYVYNESDSLKYMSGSHFLTGIIDENNVRFATFNYRNGAAFSTERADGVGRYEISDPYPSERTVKDPFGAMQTYTYQQVGASRVWRSTGIRRMSATGKGVVSSSITYDVQGNVETRTDFDGTRTEFTYDLTRNLETKRVEAAGTPSARTITTQWHFTHRLPTKIIEPLRVTNFTYDTAGNLLTKSVQATKDTTGAQGTAAVVTGSIRTWKYTYSTVGQMLTSTDPSAAVTTFTYDEKGNLATVKNALDQVTTLSNYDAHGRAARIKYPNGMVEDLTYTPRGWLETRTIGSQQWRYEYDGVGQLNLVKSPDGTSVSYTYDDAHRLVGVSDSSGNSITYTLDAMGNRTTEEVKDPANVLVRKVSRTFDTLNLLKQQTGGAL